MTSKLQPGDIVVHKNQAEWGRGIVRHVDGSRVTVDFESRELGASSKRIKADFLEKSAGPAPVFGDTGGRDQIDSVELRRLVRAFVGVANKAGIESIASRIEAAFIDRSVDDPGTRGEIKRQLQRWVRTNPDGRHAVAIPAATALYAFLFGNRDQAPSGREPG